MAPPLFDPDVHSGRAGRSVLAPKAPVRFVQGGAPPDIDVGLVVGLSVVGAIPAVMIAAFVVKAMPVETMRWLVVAVILYAAAVLLRQATRREVQPLEPLAEGLLD